MSDETGNFVSQRLGGDQGDFLDDPLVGVEVKRQFSVVPEMFKIRRSKLIFLSLKKQCLLFDNDPSGLLDGLGANTAHFDAYKEKNLIFLRLFGKTRLGKRKLSAAFWRNFFSKQKLTQLFPSQQLQLPARENRSKSK